MKVENTLAGLKATSESARLFIQAQEVIASGVNSTARAPRSGWSPYPLFIKHGKGSRIVDADGNEFIDYLLGLGPMLLGHRPERVTRAVVDFITQRGTMFALPVADEIDLARKIIAAVAEGDMLRTQLAILRRLAKYEPFNTIALRQQIAQTILERGRYSLT